MAHERIGLEELESLVGQDVGHSGWIEVAQERINGFAEVTEDRQWIHTDPDRAARESLYGTTVVHGFLTLALLPRLIAEAVPLRQAPRTCVNQGLNHVRFLRVIPSGAHVRALFTLLALEKVLWGKQATWGVTIEARGAKGPCCVAEWVVRYYP